MLTGDRKDVGEAVAESLGIDEVYTDLLPGDKVDKVEALLGELSEKESLVLLVMVSMMHRYSPELISESQWEAWDPTQQSKPQMLF